MTKKGREKEKLEDYGDRRVKEKGKLGKNVGKLEGGKRKLGKGEGGGKMKLNKAKKKEIR